MQTKEEAHRVFDLEDKISKIQGIANVQIEPLQNELDEIYCNAELREKNVILGEDVMLALWDRPIKRIQISRVIANGCYAQIMYRAYKKNGGLEASEHSLSGTITKIP